MEDRKPVIDRKETIVKSGQDRWRIVVNGLIETRRERERERKIKRDGCVTRIRGSLNGERDVLVVDPCCRSRSFRMMQWCSDGAYQSGYRGCTTIVMMKISFNFVFHKSLQRSIIIIEISGMRKEEYYTVYNSVSIFSHLFCHPRYISSSSRFLEDIFKKQSYSNSKWDVFENNGEVVRWVGHNW